MDYYSSSLLNTSKGDFTKTGSLKKSYKLGILLGRCKAMKVIWWLNYSPSATVNTVSCLNQESTVSLKN